MTADVHYDFSRNCCQFSFSISGWMYKKKGLHSDYIFFLSNVHKKNGSALWVS